MAAVVDYTEGELRMAFRELRLLNTTFEQCMEQQALAIAVRRMADRARRRAERARRFDPKRAQANDID